MLFSLKFVTQAERREFFKDPMESEFTDLLSKWIVSTSQGIKCVWGEFNKQGQMSSLRSSFMPPVQYNGPTRNPYLAETSIRI